jgi:uncharacterized protein (DUF488 family)
MSQIGIRPIYTLGHSTRSLEELVAILKEFGVTHLVDVRTVPRSRHNPQFNKEALPGSLAEVGIAYTHMPGLGGLRKPHPDSPNMGWRNASFRGFADYMQTAEFEQALNNLVDLAGIEQAVAILCAEAVPWRCHRSLIGDALLARGFPVIDILSPGSSRPHALTGWAVVQGQQVTYPAESAPEDDQS